MRFDLQDLHIYGGLLVAAVGAGAYDWRVGLVLGGTYLAFIGLSAREAR
jgi:uncharacterized protein with beta-barrel porin domain